MTRPCSMSSSITPRTRFTGMAKPMPSAGLRFGVADPPIVGFTAER